MATARPRSAAERTAHRRLGAAAFNATWSYLERRRLRPSDELPMLDLAHASRYHWGFVGTPRNLAIADWQLARVYAKLGESRLSEAYAKAALNRCQRYGIRELLPSAREGLARAYAVGGRRTLARSELGKAKELLGHLRLERESREIFEGQIRDTERLLRRRGPR